MGTTLCIGLWLFLSFILCLPLGKSIYKRCHYHLSFTLSFDKDSTENARQKLKITIKNRSIHKILIQEVGLYHPKTNEFYSFHKLIDGSSTLPTWLNSNESLYFIQYIVDLSPSFRKEFNQLQPYAKDSQGRIYL